MNITLFVIILAVIGLFLVFYKKKQLAEQDALLRNQKEGNTRLENLHKDLIIPQDKVNNINDFGDITSEASQAMLKRIQYWETQKIKKKTLNENLFKLFNEYSNIESDKFNKKRDQLIISGSDDLSELDDYSNLRAYKPEEFSKLLTTKYVRYVGDNKDYGVDPVLASDLVLCHFNLNSDITKIVFIKACYNSFKQIEIKDYQALFGQLNFLQKKLLPHVEVLVMDMGGLTEAHTEEISRLRFKNHRVVVYSTLENTQELIETMEQAVGTSLEDLCVEA